MGRLVRDDRKATVTQKTTRYNQGMQNTISEHTTRQTLKQMEFCLCLTASQNEVAVTAWIYTVSNSFI